MFLKKRIFIFIVLGVVHLFMFPCQVLSTSLCGGGGSAGAGLSADGHLQIMDRYLSYKGVHSLEKLPEAINRFYR